ncbi:MAG: hypothetical protein OXU61_01825 [Gammaproteobacteria bacterium]|nr:hypothetical protein [Gammaproteobacteria bacterium]
MRFGHACRQSARADDFQLVFAKPLRNQGEKIPAPLFPRPHLPFLRKQESSIESARFALLCRNSRLREGRSVRLCNVRVPRSICAGFLPAQE